MLYQSERRFCGVLLDSKTILLRRASFVFLFIVAFFITITIFIFPQDASAEGTVFLGSGTDPVSTTIAPGSEMSSAGVFTLQADTATSSITNMSVELLEPGSPVGDYNGLTITVDGIGTWGGKAIISDTDGNMYVVGYQDELSNYYDPNWVIQKYTATGTLDTSWGTEGTIIYDHSPGGFDNYYDYANDIAIDSDRNIYVAGMIDGEIGGGREDFAVRKYNASGTLDTSWGDNGMVVYDSGTRDSAEAITIDSDRNIYVGGGGGWNGDYIIRKYTATGTLDTSWGVNGMATYDYYLSYSRFDYLNDITIDTYKNVYVAGVVDSDNPGKWGIVKFNALGTLDTSWGSSGAIIYDSGAGSSYDGAYAVAIDPDRNIYVTGYIDPAGTWGGETKIHIRKYNASGTLVTSWGTNGSSTYQYKSGGSDGAFDIAIDGDRNIYITGYSETGASYNDTDFLTLKYNASGTLDTAWGNGQPVFYDAGGEDSAWGVAVNEANKDVYVVGQGNSKIVIKKYSELPNFLSEVRITSEDGNTTYFSPIQNSSSTVLNFYSGTSIPVITATTTFKIQATPKSHADMPVSPGYEYFLSPYAMNLTTGNGYSVSGSDDNPEILVIDNLSPLSVTSATITTTTQIVVSWQNSTSTDFSEVVVVKSSSTNTGTPTEGVAYVSENLMGNGSVFYVGNATTVIDAFIPDGITYYYKIWGRDTYGNYTSIAPEVSGYLLPNNFIDVGIDPTSTTTAPESGTHTLGKFTVSTNGAESSFSDFSLDLGYSNFPSWGVNGSSTYNSGGTQSDYIRAITIDSDHNIYVGGYQGTNGDDWHIRKYNASGTLDTSWGVNGSSTYNSISTKSDQIKSIVIDSDRNIYVAGFRGTTSSDNDWHIRKYNASGTLDTNWGVNGSSTYNSGGTQYDYASAITIDSDRNIYVAGYIGTNGGDWHIRKYNASGTLNTSWGVNGSSTYNSGGTEYANAITIDSDRNIYVGGYIGTNGGDWHIRKYNASGTLDTNWGVNGSSTYNSLGGSDTVQAITIDSDRNIYVAGYQTDSGGYYDWHIRKYNASGTLDTNWGVNGSSTYNSGQSKYDNLYSIIIDSDRNIYAGGYDQKNSTGWHIRKYNASGTLDTSWRTGGFASYNSPGSGDDRIYAITIDSDRNIYAAGHHQPSGNIDWRIQKYFNLPNFLSDIRITSEDGNTTYFDPITNPSSDLLTFSGGTPLPVTNTTTTFAIRATIKDHEGMPSPFVGEEYSLAPYIFEVTSAGNSSNYIFDSNSNTFTIDNFSPLSVTNVTSTASTTQILVSWDNSTSIDFSEVVVVKSASSTNNGTPTEGVDYSSSNEIGNGTVLYVGGSTSTIDVDLVTSTAYYYKVWAKDIHGNYSAVGVETNLVAQGGGGVSVVFPSVSSTADDVFEIDGVPQFVSALNIKSGQGVRGKIGATNDLRIRIPSDFNAEWDPSITSITCTAGNACGKIALTGVEYEDSNKVAVINITQDFVKDEWIQISGLKMKNFTNVSIATTTNHLRVDGAADADDDASDEKTKTIKGRIAHENHSENQVSNRFDILDTTLTDAELYRFRIVAYGESATITTTTFSITGFSGIQEEDLTNLVLYRDENNSGVFDGGDIILSSSTSVHLEGSNGTIAFSGPWIATGTVPIIFKADVSNISEGDYLVLALSSVFMSATGLETDQPLVITGSSYGINHSKPFRRSGGGAVRGFEDPHPETETNTGGTTGGGGEGQMP